MSLAELTGEAEIDEDAVLARSELSRELRPTTRTRLVKSDGSVAPWWMLRYEVLHRAGFRCAECGTGADQADHIWPRRWGGTDELENLQALCGRCNKAKGARVDFLRAPNHQLRFALWSLIERLDADMWIAGDIFSHMYSRVLYGEADPQHSKAMFTDIADLLEQRAEDFRARARGIPEREGQA